MKKAISRIWTGFCRRPLLWLSLALAAALTAEWLVLYLDQIFLYNVLYSLVEYGLLLMADVSFAADVVMPVLLVAANLLFPPGTRTASDKIRRAGVRVELFTIVYGALRQGAWLVHQFQTAGYGAAETDLAPGVMVPAGGAMILAAVGYTLFRFSRRPVKRTLLIWCLCLTSLGAVAFGLLISLMIPGLMAMPACLAAVCVRAISEEVHMLAGAGKSGSESAPEEDIPPVSLPAGVDAPAADALPENPPAAEADGDVPAEPTSAEDASARRFGLKTAGIVLLAIIIITAYFLAPLLLTGSSAGNPVVAGISNILGALLILTLLFFFIFLPFALTLYNVLMLFLPRRFLSAPLQKRIATVDRWIEFITLGWGTFCTLVWTEFNFSDIRWEDWDVQLYNNEVHSPIATWTIPTVVVLMLVSLAGYLVLRLTKPEKLPPLAAALSIASLYIGGALSAVWIVQICLRDPFICLLSFNIIVIYITAMRDTIIHWRLNHPEAAQHRSAIVRFFARIMNNSANWPWLALLLAVPLMGIVIALLALLGQTPDSVIQAWTQTGGWTFSQQVSPPNLHYDEHYLCTVAAGGHKRLVKPIRKGKRHGHQVIVNRQLCVANAFEQLLEERMPRFHSAVRGFYDKYGYPIARHIKTPLAADVVWLLMKPLEWMFLGVLYLFDAKPEHRIAVQYPHAPLPEKTDEVR